MAALMDNTVKTDVATYTFNTRQEAEAFFLSLTSPTEKFADETVRDSRADSAL